MHILFLPWWLSKRNSLQAVSDWSVVLIRAHTLFLSQMFRLYHRNSMITHGLFPPHTHTYTHKNLFYSRLYLVQNTVLVASVHLCSSTIYHIESMRKHRYVYLEHIPFLFCVRTWQEKVDTLGVPARHLLAPQMTLTINQLFTYSKWRVEDRKLMRTEARDSINLWIDHIKMKDRE